MKAQNAEKRKYNSPLREQQLAETRERIITAGAELVHSFPSWDWKNLNAKAVGDRAGISERTVHRHFSTERQLRDAVLQRLVEESGINLEELELGNFGEIVVTIFNYLSSFAVAPEIVTDPSQTTMDEKRKQALLVAVSEATPGWSTGEQALVAAVLDILWQPPTFDRLKLAWGFDAENTTRVISWFTTLVQQALEKGHKP